MHWIISYKITFVCTVVLAILFILKNVFDENSNFDKHIYFNYNKNTMKLTQTGTKNYINLNIQINLIAYFILM